MWYLLSRNQPWMLFMKSFKKIIEAILILFIIYGLICTFLISLSININSDIAYDGILSLEAWNTHNFLFIGYYLNSADNHLFSELLTIYFLPQVISNFNPDALRVTAFFVYTMIILTFSYITYRITNSKVNALIFGALMANVQILPLSWFLYPTAHNGMILFTGILIILVCFLNKNNKYLHFLSIALIFLMAFSDPLIQIGRAHV